MQQSAITLHKERFFGVSVWFFSPQGRGSLYTGKKRLQIIRQNFKGRKIIFQKSSKVHMVQWLSVEALKSV